MHGCMTEYVVCNHPRADGRIAVYIEPAAAGYTGCNRAPFIVTHLIAYRVGKAMNTLLCRFKSTKCNQHTLLPVTTVLPIEAL